MWRLYNLYFSPGIKVKEDEMVGITSMHGRDEKCIQSLVRKPEGKKPPGKWEDHIKMTLT
jgi:hypothetical protein